MCISNTLKHHYAYVCMCNQIKYFAHLNIGEVTNFVRQRGSRAFLNRRRY